MWLFFALGTIFPPWVLKYGTRAPWDNLESRNRSLSQKSRPILLYTMWVCSIHSLVERKYIKRARCWLSVFHLSYKPWPWLYGTKRKKAPNGLLFSVEFFFFASNHAKAAFGSRLTGSKWIVVMFHFGMHSANHLPPQPTKFAFITITPLEARSTPVIALDWIVIPHSEKQENDIEQGR